MKHEWGEIGELEMSVRVVHVGIHTHKIMR